jgi:hypothetical protein
MDQKTRRFTDKSHCWSTTNNTYACVKTTLYQDYSDINQQYPPTFIHQYRQKLALESLDQQETMPRQTHHAPVRYDLKGIILWISEVIESLTKKKTHFNQWEFQDPKMEVLYHIRPYFAGIFTYIGLT